MQKSIALLFLAFAMVMAAATCTAAARPLVDGTAHQEETSATAGDLALPQRVDEEDLSTSKRHLLTAGRMTALDSENLMIYDTTTVTGHSGRALLQRNRISRGVSQILRGVNRGVRNILRGNIFRGVTGIVRSSLGGARTIG